MTCIGLTMLPTVVLLTLRQRGGGGGVSKSQCQFDAKRAMLGVDGFL